MCWVNYLYSKPSRYLEIQFYKQLQDMPHSVQDIKLWDISPQIFIFIFLIFICLKH